MTDAKWASEAVTLTFRPTKAPLISVIVAALGIAQSIRLDGVIGTSTSIIYYCSTSITM